MDNVDEPIKTPANDVDDTAVILEELKASADEYGIKYGKNIGAPRLQAKINQFLMDANATKVKELKKPTESKGQRKARLRREAGELVRCRVVCNNPNKRNWPGEIISVGNGSIGTFKKFIPFGLEGAWHIPKIILNAMQEREYQSFYTVKHPGKRPDEKRSKLLKEFNIEILPALTPKELEELAQEQTINRSLDAE